MHFVSNYLEKIIVITANNNFVGSEDKMHRNMIFRQIILFPLRNEFLK